MHRFSVSHVPVEEVAPCHPLLAALDGLVPVYELDTPCSGTSALLPAVSRLLVGRTVTPGPPSPLASVVSDHAVRALTDASIFLLQLRLTLCALRSAWTRMQALHRTDPTLYLTLPPFVSVFRATVAHALTSMHASVSLAALHTAHAEFEARVEAGGGRSLAALRAAHDAYADAVAGACTLPPRRGGEGGGLRGVCSVTLELCDVLEEFGDTAEEGGADVGALLEASLVVWGRWLQVWSD